VERRDVFAVVSTGREGADSKQLTANSKTEMVDEFYAGFKNNGKAEY